MSSATVPAARASRPSWRETWAVRLQRRDVQRNIVNIAVIVIIGSVVQVMTGKFFTVGNLEAISIQIAVVTMIACAMTLVMVAGSIDISVSGTVVLAGIVAGQLIVNGTPMWLAFIVAVVVGALVGLVNSFLVLYVGITSLIATIGTLYVTQGVANLLTGGLPIAGLPESFNTIGSGSIGLGIPIAVPMIIVVVGIFLIIQRYTVLGRNAVATGSNPQAAFLNGINVQVTTIGCFLLTGAAAGWGGVVYASRIGSPSPVLDQDLLFQVIVAIVIGGTSLFGGEGSVFGTFLGSLIIGVLNNGLNLLGISTFWQFIALGVLLVGSVGSDTLARRDEVQRLRKQIFGRRARAVSAGRTSGPDAGGSGVPAFSEEGSPVTERAQGVGMQEHGEAGSGSRVGAPPSEVARDGSRVR